MNLDKDNIMFLFCLHHVWIYESISILISLDSQENGSRVRYLNLQIVMWNDNVYHSI